MITPHLWAISWSKVIHMNPRKQLLHSCLLFVLFGQSYAVLFAQPLSDCDPTIQGQHYQVYCLDENGTEQIPAPVATAVCGEIEHFDYEERFIDLSFGRMGFQGYFDASNWTITKILGDEGVDVTGASNSVLVEGANHSLVSVTPGGVSRMEILIPADGMIAFDWRNVGGSNLFPEEFSLFINDQAHLLSKAAVAQGRFRRPVRKGDELRLEFRPHEYRTIEIDRFRLLSNTQSVLQRYWTATDDRGNSSHFTQLIGIEHPNIADIRFPETTPTEASRQAVMPKNTGFPFIDRDGNPQTSTDHYVLNGQQCGLQVEYVDEVQQLGKECFVYRHWMITDSYSGNIMKETQIIKLIHTPESGDCPAENLFFSPEQKSEQPNIPEISSNPFSAEQKALNHGKLNRDYPMTL